MLKVKICKRLLIFSLILSLCYIALFNFSNFSLKTAKDIFHCSTEATYSTSNANLTLNTYSTKSSNREIKQSEVQQQYGDEKETDKCDFDKFFANDSLQWFSLFNVDPNKYLFPVTHNGPTNQLLGFRDALFLSIRLNRTLILPKFYSGQVQDGGTEDTIPIQSRLDINTLAKLVAFEKNYNLPRVCENGLETVLAGKNCYFVNVRGGLVQKIFKRLEVAYPKTVKGRAEFVCSNRTPVYKDLLKQDSAATCIGYAFYGIGIRSSLRGLNKANEVLSKFHKNGQKVDASNLDDVTLYSLAFISTGLPKPVKDFASEFAKQFSIGNAWIAMHWRYNPKDWMSHCKDGKSGKYESICLKLNKIQPKDILNAGVNFLKDLKESTGKDIRTIYLATPLNQISIITGIEEEKAKLQKNGKNLTVLNSTILQKFLVEKMACKHGNKEFNNILTLVEMELCIQSFVFLYSSYSSWSDNVKNERKNKAYSKLDTELFSKVWKQHTNGSSV